MHHLSSDLIHPLPRGLPRCAHHLPPEWTGNSSDPHRVCTDIIASSGGLLLIIQREPAVALRLELQSRLNSRKPWGMRHISDSTSSSTSQSMESWKPLLVCNPLTKECKELPAADSGVLGFSSWDYHGVQVHMVVEDEANSYRVVLTFRSCVCVYTSSSNSWACLRFPQPGQWGYCNMAWGYVCASAYVRGRLYFADIVSSLGPRVSLRVFEIDEEAGGWRLHNRYDLQFQPWNQSLVQRFSDFGLQMDLETPIHWNLELVECMGQMFAVIPTGLDDSLSLEATGTISGALMVPNWVARNADLEYMDMPLQFHILLLQGGACSAHGVLRIQIPSTTGNIQHRRQSLLEKTRLWNRELNFRNWFRCTARGSSIWLSCEDYLLEYDVVSHQSKTQIIPARIRELSFTDAAASSYRPSFHMSP